MSSDVEAELARLAAEWDTRAPVIDATEVMAAAASRAHAVDVAFEPSTPTDPRRIRVALAIAASLIVVVGVVTVIAQRRPTTFEPAAPAGPAMAVDPEPTATSIPIPVASGPPTPSTDDGAPAPTSTSAPPDPTAVFDAFATERRAALAGYDSVSFTAVVEEQYDGRPEISTTRTNRVVLQAAGSLYATGDSFIANSYDAETGVARVHFRNLDGTETYQEVVGWADNSVPLMTMLGSLDPTAPVGEGPEGDLTEGLVEGRSVWIVERDLGGQIERWTVDRTSGLVTEYVVEWTFDDGSGARARRTVRLDDIETGVSMPPGFPYEFPVGADVERSGDPDGFRSLSLADAAAAFGPGFVAPADLPADAVITVRSQDTSLTVPDPAAPIGSVELPMLDASAEITIREGFSRTTLYLYTLRTLPGSASPPGWIDAGDGSCPSSDGVECDDPVGDGADVLEDGAWAGVPYWIERGNFSASRNGVSLSISAGADERALALAESLIAP